MNIANNTTEQYATWIKIMFILTRVFSFGFADPKISDDVGFLISIVGLQEKKISWEFSYV